MIPVKRVNTKMFRVELNVNLVEKDSFPSESHSICSDFKLLFMIVGLLSWCSGETVHFPLVWPGFISYPMCLLLVLALPQGFFSGFSGFPLSTIN